MLIIINEDQMKFSHPKEESPKMHKLLKEIIKEYEILYKKKFYIRRCKITKEGIKIK